MPTRPKKMPLHLVKTDLDEVKRYKFIVLDCPYDTWNSPVTQHLFCKMVELKLKGYLMSYPYGTLPLDTIDFVATHLLICEEHQGQWIPVMSYKCVKFSRCKIHQLPFPAVSVLEAAGAKTHLSEVQNLLNQAVSGGKEISYDGSWTMTPELRKNKSQSELLKRIMIAITVYYHQNFNVPEVIGFGLPRFKTEYFFETIGYTQMRHQGQVLSHVPMRSLQNEPVALVHLNAFTDYALQEARNFQSLWENCLIISDSQAANRIGSKEAA